MICMLVFSTTTTSYNEMDFGAFLSLALEARILSVPVKLPMILSHYQFILKILISTLVDYD